MQTLDDLYSWKVSVLAQTVLSFDLNAASGNLMRTMMAGLAEISRHYRPMNSADMTSSPRANFFRGH